MHFFTPYSQVGLLNVDGYYNYLLTFIDKAVDDGFIRPSQRSIIVSAPDAKELVQKLEVGVIILLCYLEKISLLANSCLGFLAIIIINLESSFKYGKDNLGFEEKRRIFFSDTILGIS